MLTVVKPSPLRLWGFLLTVVGGAAIAFGSVSAWAAVSFGGSTAGAVPTNGLDLWQGKLTLALGVAIVVSILALRIVGPGRRRIVAATIVAAATIALVIGLWCAFALDSVVRDSGVDQLVREVVDQLGVPVAQARSLVEHAMAKAGVDVVARPGLWITVAGGALAVAGGIVDLAWVRRKREAGDAIDPDTASDGVERQPSPSADGL